MTLTTHGLGEITIQSGSLVDSHDSGAYHYDGPLGDAAYGEWGNIGYVEWSGLASPIRYSASLGDYFNHIDRADCFDGGNICNYEQWEEMEYHTATASFSLNSAAVFQVTQAGNLGLEITNGQTGVIWHNDVMDTLPPVVYLAPGTWNFEVADVGEGISSNTSSNWYDEESGSFDYSSNSSYNTSGWVEITNAVLQGRVITIGDVHPGETGIQPDFWSMRGDLSIAKIGTGTLKVSDGGVVSNNNGYLGQESGSTGEATVTDEGSRWDNASDLVVGHRGHGKLDIMSGGLVSNENSDIANEFGSTGQVTVIGASSHWKNSGNLVVGRSGEGSLTIANRGLVSNRNGIIAAKSDSTSAVNVTGIGSHWNNAGDLVVGYEGNATLTIDNGGLVSVNRTTSIGPTSAVHLTRGRFEFGETSLIAFNRINAINGDLAGRVNVNGVNGVAAFAGLQNPLVDQSEVTVAFDPSSTTVLDIFNLGDLPGHHDSINFPGSVNLAGSLHLKPIEPYTDPILRGTSDHFVIVQASACNGTFDTVQYDGSLLEPDFGPDTDGSFRSHHGNGLFRNITYTATTVELWNLLAIEGDTDGDQDVDITDFNNLAANFDPSGENAPHPWQDGNFDEDLDVDITDFNFLAANFNSDGYATSALPEPSPIFLVSLAVMMLNISPRLLKNEFD